MHGLSTWTELPPSTRAATAVRLSGLVDTRVLDLILVDTWVMLHQLGLHAVVSARVKSPESVAAKAQRKGIAPESVLDRLALRIRVHEINDCYDIFDQICQRWSPVEGSQDDYIAAPKANGYQSLHTAVHTPFGAVEFQVRTHEMHQHAEAGGASHEAYKAMMQAA